MGKIKDFHEKIKVKLLIISAIIICFIFAAIGYKVAEFRLTKFHGLAIETLEQKMLLEYKTVQIDDFKELSKSYSAYLRKPLLSSDSVEVSIIMNKLIAKSNILKYVLINDENVVIFSSDKNFKGKFAKDCLENSFIDVIKQQVETEENLIKVATPIVGVNDLGGVLYLEKVIK